MKRIAIVLTALALMASGAQAQMYNGNGCNMNGCGPYRHHHHGHHRHWHGGNDGVAIGLGILGGIMIGGMIAQPRPYYVDPYPRRCWLEDRFDYWGNWIGRVRICN